MLLKVSINIQQQYVKIIEQEGNILKILAYSLLASVRCMVFWGYMTLLQLSILYTVVMNIS